jgi:hypothetical protein
MRQASTRRAVLAALAAGALPARALAQPADVPGFSAVEVDVRRLREVGLGPYAEVVGGVLRAELRRAFSDRLVRRGPRLVVRVDGVSLRSYVGGESSRFGFGSGTPSDYLEGEALVIGAGGEILRRHPQLSAVPASSGGAWYDPDSERRRLVSLAAHFAGWLRRSL